MNYKLSKVNDKYLCKLFKDKFSIILNPKVVPNGKGTMYYAAFENDTDVYIEQDYVQGKREALYSSAWNAVKFLIEHGAIEKKHKDYYNRTLNQLYNGEICYS